MSMLKAKAKSAKCRRAQEQLERIKLSSHQIEKSVLVITRCKAMPDMPALPKPRKRAVKEDALLAPGQLGASARQKMRGCSRIPRGII